MEITMLEIESADNRTYKKLLSLTAAKGLKQEGLFLLSGENLVREFIQSPKLKIHYELLTTKLKPLVSDSSVEKIQLKPDLFDAIDGIGTRFNILVLEQPPMEKLDASALKSCGPKGIELVIP